MVNQFVSYLVGKLEIRKTGCLLTKFLCPIADVEEDWPLH